MKIRKIIYLLLAVILVVTSIGSGFFRRGENVEAATRMNGIQQIVDDISTEEPFVILELVPDEAYASFGAYILGEEPAIDVRFLTGCLTEQARREKVESLLTGIAVGKSADKNGTKYPMFYENSSPYEERVAAPADMMGWGVIEFEPTDNGDGTFTYHSEEKVGIYEAVGEGEIGDYTAIPAEDDKQSGTVSGGESGTVSGGESGTVSGGESDTVSGGESTEESINYTYLYTPGAGTHRWVDKAGEKTYEVTFEKIYYRVNVTSNDWFSKRVFECEQEERAEKSIKVITLTPSQLEENITQGYLAQSGEDVVVQDWSDVDLLYISNSSGLKLTEGDKALLDTYVRTDEEGKYINDISAQVGYIIYEYVFNTSLPVIVDSSIVWLGSGLSDSSTNLQKLAYLLWDYTTDMQPNSYRLGETVIDLSAWTTEWPAGLSGLLVANIAQKPFANYGSVQGSVYFNNFANMVD